MEIFNNHKKMFGAAFILFAGLTIFVAIMPALNNQNNNAPLPDVEAQSEDVIAGKNLYISNGCVACHSQQVRNVEMDKMWGSRPSIAADYAGVIRTDFWRNTATLMGTERTGPDLINIGNRQPSLEWHLLHLYQPRSVVKESIMPAYSWLFKEKEYVAIGEVEVNVPENYRNGKGKIVATRQALQLVAYLQSLKQLPLPEGNPSPEFLYKKEVKSSETASGDKDMLNGEVLYASNCQSCHQSNGEGLKGAFPPLKGSQVVLNDNPELMVNIIMKGYNPREEFAVMPAVGMNNNLKPEEISAIMNYVKTGWGNNARKVKIPEVEKIVSSLK